MKIFEVYETETMFTIFKNDKNGSYILKSEEQVSVDDILIIKNKDTNESLKYKIVSILDNSSKILTKNYYLLLLEKIKED